MHPVGFYFNVVVADISGTDEGNFQEVSGIEVKIDTEPFKEGGENRFVRRLPNPPKYSNLILKRGIVIDSGLITWARSAVENFIFTPKLVVVNLLNDQGTPLATWSFSKAYPVALKVDNLNSTSDKVFCESIELAYEYFVRGTIEEN